MKRIFLVFLIFIICLLPLSSMAADKQNNAVSKIEGDTWILYYGVISMISTDTTDNHFTQAMYIAGCNKDYGYIQIVANDSAGTEDANGLLEYSNAVQSSGVIAHATFAGITTNAGLDQIQTTVKRDTVGVVLGTDDDFKNSMWMRIKLDGQTSNPHSLWNWWIWLYKDTGTPKNGVAGMKNTS